MSSFAIGGRKGLRLPLLSVPILLLAFGLRTHRLGNQALSGDEAWTVDIASRASVPDLLGAVQATDVHPPLYYLLLHYWGAAAGYTEYAVRFFSVLADIASIALLVVLARRLIGGRAAPVAALLITAGPMSVYYSQDARMYTLLVLFTLASSAIAYEYLATRHPSPRASPSNTLPKASPLMAGRLWWLYLLVTAAALFTHYFSLFVLLFQNIYFLAWSPARRRHWKGWLSAQVLLGASLLPWFLLNAGGMRAMGGQPGGDVPSRAASLLYQSWAGFAAGVTASQEQTMALAVLAGILAVPGMLWLLWRQQIGIGKGLFLALYLVVPFAAMVGAAAFTPYFFARYLMVAIPAFYLLLAAILVRTPVRSLGMLAGILVLGGWAVSLHNLYLVPAYSRPDYRALVSQIEAAAMEGDAIVLGSPLGNQIHNYYYHGPLPTYSLYSQPGAAAGAATADLARLIASYRRLWVVPTGMLGLHDPQHQSIQWLSQNAYKALDRSPGGYQVVLYATGTGNDTGSERPLAGVPADFGGRLRLEAATAARLSVQPGEAIPFILQWKAGETAGVDYKVALHLLDRTGRVMAQRDAWPGDGFRPTRSWAPGEEITDRMGLWIPPDTPQGLYDLRLVVYEAEGKMPRLPVSNGSGDQGDTLRLGLVQVRGVLTEESVSAVAVPLRASYGEGIELLGYQASQIAAADGQTQIGITLYWRAAAPTARDYTVFAHLVDEGGNLLAQADGPPAAGAYPTSVWLAGEIVADQRQIPLPAGSSQVHLALLAGWYYPPTMERLPLLYCPAQSPEREAVAIPLAQYLR